MVDLVKKAEEIFGLDSYGNVMEFVENGTTVAGYGDRRQVDILKDDKFGLIPLRDYFESHQSDFEILTLDELEYFNENRNWEEHNGDNTYNHSGYSERDFTFHSFKNTDDSQVMVLYSIHVGLDVRTGYTKLFPFLYEDEFSFMEHAMNRFTVAYATFEQDGKEFSVDVSAEAFSDYKEVYIQDYNHNQELADDVGYDIDVSDKQSFVESLEEYLYNNDIDFDDGSIEVE